MRKLFVVLFSLFLVASLGAQEKKLKRIFFNYENGQSWRHAVGDTLTGVTAGANSLDSIFFSAVDGNGNLANRLLFHVQKDTDLLGPQAIGDTTQIRIHGGLGLGSYETVGDSMGTYLRASGATIKGFLNNDIVFEYRLDAGQNTPAKAYVFVIDHTAMANTDSTAYKLAIYGEFNEN